MFNNKLILGTANIAKGYGIMNKKGVSSKVIKNLIKFSRKNKIYGLDTAYSYRGVEKNIGKVNLANLKICTKTPKIIKKKEILIEKYFYKAVKSSSIRINVKSFYVVFIHKSEDLFGPKGEEIYKAMLNLKKGGITKKIGVSVYSPEDLKKILKKYFFDVVQIPINVFDRRFLKKNYLYELKKKNIEIHARSIFLQGMLLLDQNLLPSYFRRWQKLFNKWQEWNKQHNVKKVHTCLNFIKNVNYIDKIVIGVSNIDGFQEIINYRKIEKLFPKKIFSADKKLLDPRLW